MPSAVVRTCPPYLIECTFWVRTDSNHFPFSREKKTTGGSNVPNLSYRVYFLGGGQFRTTFHFHGKETEEGAGGGGPPAYHPIDQTSVHLHWWCTWLVTRVVGSSLPPPLPPAVSLSLAFRVVRTCPTYLIECTFWVRADSNHFSIFPGKKRSVVRTCPTYLIECTF